MLWVIIQIAIFSALLLPSEDVDFTAPSWAEVPLVLIFIAGWLILLKAVYDLRRSLAVDPNPKKDGTLITDGIYSAIRHPMYLGVWLVFGSSILRSGSFMKVRLFILLLIFFVIKMWHEENLLLKKYPKYKKYKSSTGAFIPKLPIPLHKSTREKK